MRSLPRLLILLAVLPAAADLLGAQAGEPPLRAVSERIEPSRATGAFAFRGIPSPAGRSPGGSLSFSIASGSADPNGKGPWSLGLGSLPSREDQPDANFFFGPGQDGGRLLLDLGAPVLVSRICSYSWHPGSRGPQVYRLYAAAGGEPGFDPPPGAGKDPESSGWTFLASVDTRPGGQALGGQYGVDLSSPRGSFGPYRYFLFDFRAVETADPYGNTFLSAVDVIETEPRKLPSPPSKRACLSLSPPSSRFRIAIDYAADPELGPWVDARLRPIVDAWYPRLIAELGGRHFVPREELTILFSRDYSGVAEARGATIVCSDSWFRANLDGEAPGAVVHELVHAVQLYPPGAPSWLVEGIADYYRWFEFEAEPRGTRPADPDKASYAEGYRVAAGFLRYLSASFPDIVPKLNQALREGSYGRRTWKSLAGAGLDELWAGYVASLKALR